MISKVIQILLHPAAASEKASKSHKDRRKEVPIKIQQGNLSQSLEAKDFPTVRRMVAPFLQDQTGLRIVGG